MAAPARKLKPNDEESLSYLKTPEISSVLSAALGELYLAKPKNQLYFLGNWLLNYSISQRNLNIEVLKNEVKDSLREKHEKALESHRETEQRLKTEAERIQKQDAELKERIYASVDVDDFLQEVIEHLKRDSNAAAAYIGIQEKVKRAITVLDDEKAHIDEEAPLVIRYIHASENSRFMVDQILKEEEGQATWSIWKEEEEEEPVEEELPERYVKKPKVKVISVDDVVNDSRIKFFDVPKLGAYFAVPLNYKSCLFEASFDAGIDDAIECRKLRAQQDEEKAKYEAESKDDQEPKEFEQIKEAEYKSIEVRLVVAADTLGQDRVFSDYEKEFIVNWVTLLKNEWERAETQSLNHDIKAYLPIRDRDQQRLHDKSVEWAEEEREAHDSALKLLHATLPDDYKALETQAAVFELLRTRVLNEFENLLVFTSFKVVKFSRIFQIAFYLNEIPREEIVEPGTNMIQWKRSKRFLNKEFKEFLASIKPRGPKSYKPKPYAKTMFLEKELQRINIEEVMNYCVGLGFLYKFLVQYVKLRIMDVTYRRKEYSNKAEVRENAIRAAKELAERKQKYFDDANEAFEKELDALDEGAERGVFDRLKVLEEFDAIEGNQPIEIPDEIIPDEDGDIDWEDLAGPS